MKMTKKLAMAAVAAVMTASLAIGGTLMFLQDTDSVTNKLSVGYLTCEIEENDQEGWESGKTIKPGDAANKSPYVKNTGSVSAWVRAKVEVTGATADDADLASAIVLNGLGNGWSAKQADGWYYYTAAMIAPNAGTPTPLFTTVELDNTYQETNADRHVNIIVDAEAVQDINGACISSFAALNQ